MKTLLAALLLLAVTVQAAEPLALQWHPMPEAVKYRVYFAVTMVGPWYLLEETESTEMLVNITSMVENPSIGAVFITVLAVDANGGESLPCPPLYINLNTDKWRPRDEN